MKKISVRLAPVWIDDRISRIRVEIQVTDTQIPAQEELFALNQMTVGIPFLELSEAVRVISDHKQVQISTRINREQYITKEVFYAEQPIDKEYSVSYEAVLGEAGRNPVFDLGYEDQGMNGSGMTFLPSFPKGSYEITLHWDSCNLPENHTCVWSYGTGVQSVTGDENTLTETFYYAGPLSSVGLGRCGFYWLEYPGLNGREVGTFVTELFDRMAEFFRDSGEVFHVFARKLPEILTGRNKMGGTALRRSFTFVYAKEHPPESADLKFLFPHEFVHNWITLTDEPFGTCTWYVEGMAEFYSIILADRFGILSRGELVAQMNKRARDYYENPRNQMPNMEVGKLLFQDPEATLVPYGRGFFYLLHVDSQIRKHTNGRVSLDEVMYAIMELTRKGQTCGNETWLAQVTKLSGLDIRREFAEMEAGRIFAPELAAFTTRLDCFETKGTIRETGEDCCLYQFA